MKQIRLHKSMIPDVLNIKNILKTKQVSNNKYVKKLEKKLKKIHGVKYVICFNSCTTSLLGLLYILQPKIVALPSFTWISPKLILDMLKINKIYMDINKETWVVDKNEQIKYDSNVDLFLLNSSFGNKPFVEYPNKTIIDSAHCAGHSGFGCLGIAEVLSFSPMKTMTGIEGGAVLTNNDVLAEKLITLQPILGRMGEINAKVALYNINRRKKIFKWKKEVFEAYKQAFGEHRLQKINEYSTLNEIGLIIDNKHFNNINKVLEIRKRYDTNFVGIHQSFCGKNTPIADNIFNNSIVLPSYLGCDYKKVIKKIKKIENLK